MFQLTHWSQFLAIQFLLKTNIELNIVYYCLNLYIPKYKQLYTYVLYSNILCWWNMAPGCHNRKLSQKWAPLQSKSIHYFERRFMRVYILVHHRTYTAVYEKSIHPKETHQFLTNKFVSRLSSCSASSNWNFLTNSPSIKPKQNTTY